MAPRGAVVLAAEARECGAAPRRRRGRRLAVPGARVRPGGYAQRPARRPLCRGRRRPAGRRHRRRRRGDPPGGPVAPGPQAVEHPDGRPPRRPAGAGGAAGGGLRPGLPPRRPGRHRQHDRPDGAGRHAAVHGAGADRRRARTALAGGRRLWPGRPALPRDHRPAAVRGAVGRRDAGPGPRPGPGPAASAQPGDPPRPGDDLSEMPPQGAVAAVCDGPRGGRRPASIPRRRGDRGAAGTRRRSRPGDGAAVTRPSRRWRPGWPRRS